MDFCYDLIYHPDQMIHKYDSTPLLIGREDSLELVKHGGKSIIVHQEAFFLSPKKSIHLSYKNDSKYLVLFTRGRIIRFEEDRIREEKSFYPVPQTVEQIQLFERQIYDVCHSSSCPIPIKTSYSAPL